MDIEGLGNTYSEALAINASGTEIVGDSGGHAFLYSGGKMRDLNTLIPRGTGWELYAATGIDDTGEIVGYGAIRGGDVHAFLLTPARAGTSRRRALN
jgi:probable HAF family extracellular repeat protein